MTKFVDRYTGRNFTGKRSIPIWEVIRHNLAWRNNVCNDPDLADDYLVEVLSRVVSILDQLNLIGSDDLQAIGGIFDVAEDPDVT